MICWADLLVIVHNMVSMSDLLVFPLFLISLHLSYLPVTATILFQSQIALAISTLRLLCGKKPCIRQRQQLQMSSQEKQPGSLSVPRSKGESLSCSIICLLMITVLTSRKGASEEAETNNGCTLITSHATPFPILRSCRDLSNSKAAEKGRHKRKGVRKTEQASRRALKS